VADLNSPVQPVLMRAVCLDASKEIKHFSLGNSGGWAKANRMCCRNLTEVSDLFMVVVTFLKELL